MERRRHRAAVRAWRLWLIAGVSAGFLAVWAPAAMAGAFGDGEDLTPVAPPASSQCAGPGCTDDQALVQAALLLLGTGPGCADGGVCFWVQTGFDGGKARVDDAPCCQWFLVTDIDRYRSSKNRFLSRKVQTGNANNVTSCMDPGESRSDLEVSDRFRVGAVGSSC
jgi:hypothetical protein